MKKLMLFLISLMLFSCKVVQDTYNSRSVDTCYISQTYKDSIYIRDSIFVDNRTKNDTVFITLEKWHTKYYDKIRLDTIYFYSTDTLEVSNTITLPPEKYVPKTLLFTSAIGIVTLLYLIIKFILKIKGG